MQNILFDKHCAFIFSFSTQVFSYTSRNLKISIMDTLKIRKLEQATVLAMSNDNSIHCKVNHN